MSLFAVYWGTLVLGVFLYRVLRTHTLHLPAVSRAERGTLALLVALLVALYACSVVLLRAKPVKCWGGAGLALAYATSGVLLVAVRLALFGITYVELRNCSLAELSRVNAYRSLRHKE